jgi:rhodanese-related sulfurtransferase
VIVTVVATLKTLDFDDALTAVDRGAAFVDLRPTTAYLDVHVPGSLALLYEFGPGMAQRARDCIPLDVPLIMLDLDHGDVLHATASLRGKGFTVLGEVDDGINAWAERRGTPASTEAALGLSRPEGTVLDVGDPGAERPRDATVIPTERLWHRSHEFAGAQRVAIVAGYGVRAALAVGMLERAGVGELVFWKTRP